MSGNLPGIALLPGTIVRFRYTNHKLETEWRRALVHHVWWGATQYHRGCQWFLHAECQDRHEPRNFAMRDMTEVSIIDIPAEAA